MPSRSVCAAALAIAAVAITTTACDDVALVLELESRRLSVPDQLDAVCVSVAALDAAGDDGAFARRYAIDALPQTLTVMPGGHEEVQIWARGTRAGVEVARAGARTSFGGGVSRLPLDVTPCAQVTAPSPRVAGTALAPAGSRALVALGWREPVVVVLAGGEAFRLAARRGQGLVPRSGGLPDAPTGVLAAAAVDVDGDCDDDLLIAPPGEGPLVWRQDGDGGFAAVELPVVSRATAIAAADVDGDGDVDLVVGGGGELRLLRNDGTGRYQEDVAALPGGAVTDVTALVFADVTRDGHPDLVVGQGTSAPAPLRLLVNDAAGTGSFALAAGALPELPQRARAFAAGDLDGDGDADLVVVGEGAPVRLYVNRGDGRLEDRSFVRLPSADPIDGASVAAVDVDGDCLPDLVVGALGGGAPIFWRGTDTGVFVAGALPAEAAGAWVAVDDADGDGSRDVVVSGDQGVAWIAPR